MTTWSEYRRYSLYLLPVTKEQTTLIEQRKRMKPRNRKQPWKLTVIEEMDNTEPESTVDEKQTNSTDVHIHSEVNRTTEDHISQVGIIRENNAAHSKDLSTIMDETKNCFGMNKGWIHHCASVFDKVKMEDFWKAKMDVGCSTLKTEHYFDILSQKLDHLSS